MFMSYSLKRPESLAVSVSVFAFLFVWIIFGFNEAQVLIAMHILFLQYNYNI